MDEYSKDILNSAYRYFKKYNDRKYVLVIEDGDVLMEYSESADKLEKLGYIASLSEDVKIDPIELTFGSTLTYEITEPGISYASENF